MERRLTVILSTDVVGYSGLMERDEEGTFEALKHRRTTLFQPSVERHGGTVIKLMGDGALIEFRSVVEAVNCALEIQASNKRANEGIDEARHIALRIGINIGEVIADGDDIFGTGVNIAARLQQLASSGGICLSGPTYQQLPDKRLDQCHYRGRLTLRNMYEPVDVWEIGGEAAGRREPAAQAGQIPGGPAERPSVAVLPFACIGETGVEQYFADGITRDLITELSRFRSLFVIAHNSSFQLRERRSDHAKVGQDLGVQYLVDGSVQYAGDKLRLTAALVDASTGLEVWGDRYTQDASDPAVVQDRLAHDLASRLNTGLEQAELIMLKRKPPASQRAYDLWLQGAEWHESSFPNGYAKAKELYLKAIEADPGFARPYASLAELVYMESVLSNWGIEGKDDVTAAATLAQRAIQLDNQDANGHAVMAWIHMVRHEFPKAVRHWNLADSLNPNDADIKMWRATALAFLGDPPAGEAAARAAMQLNPLHPDWYLSDLAVVLFFCRKFEEMLAIYDLVPELFPHTPAWRAAALAELGRHEEATRHAADFARNIRPIWQGPKTAKPADYGRWFFDCIPLRRREEQELLREGLRAAGLYA